MNLALTPFTRRSPPLNSEVIVFLPNGNVMVGVYDYDGTNRGVQHLSLKELKAMRGYWCVAPVFQEKAS